VQVLSEQVRKLQKNHEEAGPHIFTIFERLFKFDEKTSSPPLPFESLVDEAQLLLNAGMDTTGAKLLFHVKKRD